MGDEHAQDSQQEPQQDSALQTPQPDQPHPPVQTDQERFDAQQEEARQVQEGARQRQESSSEDPEPAEGLEAEPLQGGDSSSE
jgi:hypothetical protein